MAYSFQTFSVGEVLAASKMNQVEVNIRDHVHGVSSVNANLATDALAGMLEVAVQSEMEAGTSTARAVTPGRQHYHPSAAKVWLEADNAGAVVQSYNVTSVTDVGTGEISVTIDNNLSSGGYSVVGSAILAGAMRSVTISAQSGASFSAQCFSAVVTAADPDGWCFNVHGSM